jgi:hypothetical protein
MQGFHKPFEKPYPRRAVSIAWSQEKEPADPAADCPKARVEFFGHKEEPQDETQKLAR